MLPFVTDAPTPLEQTIIRHMFSTFRDGSGAERDQDGFTRANWRQIERVFAEFLTGAPPPETKSIFDVIAKDLCDPTKAYGLSIKSKQLPKRQFDGLNKGTRVYMEIANSPAKLFDALEAKLGFAEVNFRNHESPSDVGNCVLDTIKQWHLEGKAAFDSFDPGCQVDLENSVYLCVSYRQFDPNVSRKYQVHSFSLDFPKVKKWEYHGRALRGFDPMFENEVLFDWYGLSGGQLKYYPKATSAICRSEQFQLLDPEHKDILQKSIDYWPDSMSDWRVGLSEELVKRNL